MSLILASSKQTENRATLPSENPSSFTNFFRSPIEVEPNSEIAVQSVKINRSGKVTINDSNDYFCHYFGSERYEDYDPDTDIFNSRTIRLDQGTYNLRDYPSEVQRALNAQYAHPVIFGNASVSLNSESGGAEKGLKIQFDQRASGSGVAANDASASLVAQPVYQLGTSLGINAISDDFSYTNKIFTRTADDTTSLRNGECIGMLTGRPFSLNKGSCVFDSMTDAALGQHWVVGLSRPQLEAGGDGTAADPPIQITSLPLGNRAPSRFYNPDDDSYSPSFLGVCDYCVMCNGTDIRVLQQLYDDRNDLTRMMEIDYANIAGGLTVPGGVPFLKAAWYGKYDGVRFQSEGDEITLQFKQKGKQVFDDVLKSSTIRTFNQCFKNVGDTNYALYPYINLGKGAVRCNLFETNHNDTSYKYPTYTAGGAYVPGSDMFSTEVPIHPQIYKNVGDDVKQRLGSGRGYNITEEIDTKPYYNMVDTEALDNEEFYTFEGLNPSGGVYLRHMLTVGPYNLGGDEDTLAPAQQFPSMTETLGFGDYSLLNETDNEGQVSGSGTNTILFTSTESLQKSSITSFIRLPGLTHKSFNGAQQSLSKIVYQVPQFSNDGTEFGPLYFEPGEKTYISLNNPSKMLLNSLQVQFVDYEEHELDSLDGASQVVFHIRKRK